MNSWILIYHRISAHYGFSVMFSLEPTTLFLTWETNEWGLVFPKNIYLSTWLLVHHTKQFTHYHFLYMFVM